MQRPADFCLTFGVRPNTWEREHCFTTAAYCYDYFVCDPTGRAAYVEWVGDDNLLERQFELESGQLDQLWKVVRSLGLRQGIARLPDDEGADYFLRATYNESDHIVSACGNAATFAPLIEALDAVRKSDSFQAACAQQSADSSKAIHLAQQGWRTGIL